jgi:hypothetical protein
MTTKDLIYYVDTYVHAIVAHETAPKELKAGKQAGVIAKREDLVIALGVWREGIIMEAKFGDSAKGS